MIEKLQQLLEKNTFYKKMGTATIDNISSSPKDIPNRSMKFDAMNELNLGRVVLWESGDMNFEILSIDSMDTVYTDNLSVSSESELIESITKFFEKMNDAYGKI